MQDPISTFFDAWKESEQQVRFEKISNSVTDNIQYSDPQSPSTLEGKAALSEYVGMFSQHAPGWSAVVTKSDTIAEMTRVTVAFSGPGPDGESKTQLGQYFVEKEGEQISRMVGFVGIGN